MLVKQGKNIMGMMKNAPNEYAIKRGKNMRIYQAQCVTNGL